MLKRSLLPSIVAAVLVSTAASVVPFAPSQNAGQTPTRSVYVSVLDGKGAPVGDLLAGEIAIREEGKTRSVIGFGPANVKFSVALLVDDSGLALNDFRTGLARFMNKLIGRAEFAVIGIAEQSRLVADFASGGDELGLTLRDLRSRNTAGNGHLVDAVRLALDLHQKREAVRPVILILTNQGREAGNPDVSPVMDRLVRTGTAVYVVETLRRASNSGSTGIGGYDAMSQSAADADAAESDRARNRILGDAPKDTGGRREDVINPADVPTVLEAMAVDLGSQYLLTYSSDVKAGTLARIAVTTSRRGVKVRAPARAK